MPLMNLGALSSGSTGVEDMRFQELSSNVEVSEEDYEDYAKVIARSLSSGHDAISRKVMDFMCDAARRSQNAARAHPGGFAEATVTSSFTPFEFKVGSGDDTERIVVELTVRKEGGVYHVASKKIRNCNLKGGRRAQELPPSEGLARPEDISEGRGQDERFPGYYNSVKTSLTKNRTRSQHNYFAGACGGKMSETDAEGSTCRICFETQCPMDDSFELVSPCNCSTPVHIECLRRWQHVQIEQAAQPSKEAAAARAATCEICGALLCVDGKRLKPPMRTAICRPDALEPIANGVVKKQSDSRGMKVPLRRFPASTHAAHAFSGTSVEGGQTLEVLEQDTSGEFFRVRVLNASRYQDPQGHKPEEGSVAVAQGWIQHVYLEWPGNVSGSWAPLNSQPQNPPCLPLRL